MVVAEGFTTEGRGLPVLRFMATLNAARDFGLDPAVANAIAVQFDAFRWDLEDFAAILAAALIEQGALELPNAV